MSRKLSSTEEFIKKANIVHNNQYNYDKVIYEHSKTKILITCDIHGDFTLSPNTHLSGRGCQKCTFENRIKSNSTEFIKLSEKVHNKKYNYDKVKYINSWSKVTITCPVHGDFKQSPITHSSGCGCVKCSIQNKSSNTEKFIEKAKKVHGTKFSYDKVQYIRAHSKVIITCHTHGDFEQRAYSHLNGSGCMKCLQDYIMNERLTHLNSKM